MRRQQPSWKGSSIQITLESVRIQFGLGFKYVSLRSHTPDRCSLRTQNIPNWHFLVSVPHSVHRLSMKSFGFRPPTSWRFMPDSALDITALPKALKKRIPVFHKLLTLRPLEAWQHPRNFSLNQMLFRRLIQRRQYSRKFSVLKNYSPIHLRGPQSTNVASMNLQVGTKPCFHVPTMYRISKSPSSMAGCCSMRLIPMTHGESIPLLPYVTSSSSRSNILRRSATSTSQSTLAMIFSS